MLKNFFKYSVFLALFIIFITSILFGAVVKYHYDGGLKYKYLQKTVVFLSSVPVNFLIMIKNKSFDLDKPPILTKHKEKKRFERFIEKKRNALLVIPRFDHSLNKSIVEIIDLDNFEVIHSYRHNINEMHKRVKNTKMFNRIEIDHSSQRFEYMHPLILSDGSLISQYGPAYSIDFCSNLKWINDKIWFHHSTMMDHESNIWIGGQEKINSKYVEYNKTKDLDDNLIVKISKDGQTLYKKSIIEMLIENELIDKNILSHGKDPLHLNDIEPVLSDSKYWKKGDVFLSIRNQSAIIHYRPETNKIINYLVNGPFARQHDIDIISDKEISIFNNNNFFINDKYSEILIYNFENKKYKKKFNYELKKENFQTESNGLSEILKDGSLLVEETLHGRIILFDNEGKKEWEFINKDKNGNIGRVTWSRIIENELLIEKFRSLVKDKKCSN